MVGVKISFTYTGAQSCRTNRDCTGSRWTGARSRRSGAGLSCEARRPHASDVECSRGAQSYRSENPSGVDAVVVVHAAHHRRITIESVYGSGHILSPSHCTVVLVSERYNFIVNLPD